MDSIYNLQKRASALRDKTQTDSITPEEVGGLHYDTLAYMADMEQNLDGLGIRKVYASVAAMEADTAPVGTNGKALRLGQLVTIYNASAPTAEGTGNVYAFQKPGWLLVGNVADILSLIGTEENSETEDGTVWGKLKSLAEDQSAMSGDISDLEGSLKLKVTSGGFVNLASITATELLTLINQTPKGGITLYLVTDSAGNLPSTSGETAITVSGTTKLLYFAKTEPFGVSVGDIFAVVKTTAGGTALRIIPLNDAKAASGTFPGADGLETVWDKTQINKIPTIETLANAALPKADALPSRWTDNMDNALQTGVYPWCTLGRPAGSTGAYTCIVRRTTTNDGSYDTVEQTAYGREGELGRVYKRIIFCKIDGTETQYGEWLELTQDVDIPNAVTANADLLYDHTTLLIAHDKKVNPFTLHLEPGELFLEEGTTPIIQINYSATKGDDTLDPSAYGVAELTFLTETQAGYIRQTISETTTFQLTAVREYTLFDRHVSEQTPVQTVTYTFVRPMWFGFSTYDTMADIDMDETSGFTRQPLTDTPTGTTATLTATEDASYLWLCVPDTMAVDRVTANGVTIPMTELNDGAPTGYRCYRSTATFNAGTHEISIREPQTETAIVVITEEAYNTLVENGAADEATIYLIK